MRLNIIEAFSKIKNKIIIMPIIVIIRKNDTTVS